MDTARRYGLVFNKDKCKIRHKQLKFSGLIWDENGSHPYPEKWDRIKSKPKPTNREELQQFIDMIQYLSPFIPELSVKTAPLRSLLKKDTDYNWNETHDKVFQDLKNSIHENQCLAYFNPNANTTIQGDSSMLELGATLINDYEFVAFTSKKLSDAESWYANIERELLAVVFGCERFHTYVYGKEFRIESDLKLLENVQNKNIALASQDYKGCCYDCNHIMQKSYIGPDRHENPRLLIEGIANTRWENRTWLNYTHSKHISTETSRFARSYRRRWRIKNVKASVNQWMARGCKTHS